MLLAAATLAAEADALGAAGAGEGAGAGAACVAAGAATGAVLLAGTSTRSPQPVSASNTATDEAAAKVFEEVGFMG
jgi:hypothetical protein